MASIIELIKNIRNARLGKDVRESIASAIEQTYEDASKDGNANMEVSEARGTFGTLNKRLNNSDSVKANKIEVSALIETERDSRETADSNLQNQINGLASGSPLVVSSTSEMIDTTRLYVNTTDGHWYYYGNNQWNDGGLYQSRGIANNSVRYSMLETKLQNLINVFYKEMTLDYSITGYYNRFGNYDSSPNNKTCKLEVNPGERYKFDGWVAGNMRTIIALDANSNLLGDTEEYMVPEKNTFSSTREHMIFEYVVPENCKYLYVLYYNDTYPTHFYDLDYYELNLSQLDPVINGIKNDLGYDIDQLQNFNIEQQLKNDFKWSSNISNGKFATFTFDDSLADISDIETLFESKNVPCCFATIPSKLDNLTNSGETVKEVLERAVSNGGEVLSHWTDPLTSESTDDDYNNVYIESKKTLENAGFNVNGIITAGGTNYNTQNFVKDTKIARNNYFYADLTSSGITPTVEQYYNRRNFLDSGVSAIETLIDNYINGTGTQPYSKWLNFASHGTRDTSLQDIETIIDYCLAHNVQIVTWNYLYDKFKSSELEKRIELLEN